ncbi:hypothetical protein BSL82_11735 [Tardibacter chloracetimidivorans]|uniref:Short-chain dehydrogenase n=1 Tax=Tardibacter chloracetimidivorans TaxID=1921510 RepID=A0A1L3ZW91_9SPHN|nr:SDR family NAD(P)-dependent oxidoreductase [Tardibacter chloracetimidivorans]API59898.1 hypothetical protein BSL82_11735 [Tardibacter chloracetimidivorans]
MRNLSGKVALVTGAGSGIGRAIALRLGTAGCSVAVTDLNPDAAHAVALEITEIGGEAIGLKLDVRREEDFTAAVQAIVAKFGGIDLAVNNAANTATTFTARDRDIASMDLSFWDETMHASLRGAMLGCKHVIPEMIRRGGGAIVNTSSMAGLFGFDSMSAYGAAKAAIVQLSRQVATQAGRHEIRCNTIAPGLILTPAAEAAFSQQSLDEFSRDMLVPGFGRPEDVAEVVAFLLSDSSRLITGQVIALDGGASSHGPRQGRGDGLQIG